MFGLPISTLRYYDKEGFFPNIERSSGIRKFNNTDIEAIRIIECLKKSGMQIKDIKQFIQWCSEGNSTYVKRKELFENRQKAVIEEIKQMQKTLDMIRFKCWYYEEAIKDGNEDHLNEMLPNHLPSNIQKLYDHAHE